MSIRGNGRWFLWICGVGAFAALVTAVVSWKDLVLRYHLEQLRRDPASLPSFLDASAGATKKLAADAFAREPLGMVSLFLHYYERMREGQPGALGDVDWAIVALWAKVGGNCMFWGELRWQSASQNGCFVFSNNPSIVALAERLAECHGASLDLPHYPRLMAEVLTLKAAVGRGTGWADPQKPLRVPPWAPVDGSIPSLSSALLLSRKLQKRGRAREQDAASVHELLPERALMWFSEGGAS